MRRRIASILLLTAASAFTLSPPTRAADVSPAEIDRLRMEIADLQRRLRAQEVEIERLRKIAVAGTQPATAATSQKSATTQKAPATKPASAAQPQDGPGTYRVSAGPGGRFTTTVRAKSREDAINQAMKT